MNSWRLCWALALAAIAGHAGAMPVREVDTGQTFVLIERFLDISPGRAASTAWIDLLVDSGQTVKAGQRLAIQRNLQGRVVLEYTAGASGRVDIVARGGRRDSHNVIFEIRIRAEEEKIASMPVPGGAR